MLATAPPELDDLPHGLGLLFGQSYQNTFGQTGRRMSRERAPACWLSNSVFVPRVDRNLDHVAITYNDRWFITKTHPHFHPNKNTTHKQESSENDTVSRACNRILQNREHAVSGLHRALPLGTLFLFCSYVWNKFLFRQSLICGGAVC